MKITKENNELVLRLSLKQNSYDAIGELVGQTDNLIGVIAGQSFSISQLIDLGYKDAQQEGTSYITFDTEQELRKVCKEFGLDIWEHILCGSCKKPIYGSSTFNDKGHCCWDCENAGS